MASPADEDLMRSVRNGNVRLLGSLFERYQVPLFNYYYRLTGNRQLSEDLVQDVFFRILRSRETYREGTPFAPWMYRIARNLRLDYLRKRREEALPEVDHGGPEDASPSPADQLEAFQQAELLRKALARLPDEKRELLVLSRYQDLKYSEIAELLDCDLGTVKVRMFRVLQELKQTYFALAGGGRHGGALRSAIRGLGER